MKDLIKQAYEMGKQAYGKYHIAPVNNPGFMNMVPNCSFDDSKGVKLRIDMYKAYRKGWTLAHVMSWDN
jgi:hypothetical protein